MASGNLPVQLTSFIGRERDLAEVKRSLHCSPRHAHRRRRQRQDAAGDPDGNAMGDSAFADGVWLVDLAPLREPAQLVPQLVVPRHSACAWPRTSLCWSRCWVLCGQNRCCSFWITANTSAMPALSLPKNYCPRRLSCEFWRPAASRLAIAGETIYPVSGLAWPVFECRSWDKNASRSPRCNYDAVRLFVERARAISPNFNLTSENAGVNRRNLPAAGWPPPGAGTGQRARQCVDRSGNCCAPE